MTNNTNSSWRLLNTTFSHGPVTPLVKLIRPKRGRRSSPKRRTPKNQPQPHRNPGFPPIGIKRIADSPQIVDVASEPENQAQPSPQSAKSAKKFNLFKDSFKTHQRPFSNISNVQVKRSRSAETDDNDDDIFVNFNPDTEAAPCSSCLEPISPTRKSPVAKLTHVRPTSRTSTYSDDIFLEASIDSQSPAVEVPETDSCASSVQDAAAKLEDLIESDDSLKIDPDATLKPHSPFEFKIDEDSNIDVPSIVPETSASSSGGGSALTGTATIVSCTSTSQQPLSNPYLPANPKEKRLRAKKGGFLDQLTAAVDRAKSNFAFWHQERRVGLMNSNSACYEVLEVDRTFGGCLLFVRNVDEYLMRPDDAPRIGLLLDGELKMCTKLKVGIVVEVDLSRETTGGLAVSDAEGREVHVYAGVQYIRIV